MKGCLVFSCFAIGCGLLLVAACSSSGSGSDAGSPTIDGGVGGQEAGNTMGGEAAAGMCQLPTGLPMGTGTITGQILGKTPNVVDVIASVYSINGADWELDITFSDYANECGHIEQGIPKANGNEVSLTIMTQVSGATSPFAAGTYGNVDGGAVPDAGYSYLVIGGTSALDAQCNQVGTLGAAGGTLNITAIDARHVEGNFDFVAVNIGAPNSPFQGTFNAPICNPIFPKPGANCCSP